MTCSKRLDNVEEIKLLRKSKPHERTVMNKSALDKRKITSSFPHAIILKSSLIPQLHKLPSCKKKNCLSIASHIFQRQNF